MIALRPCFLLACCVYGKLTDSLEGELRAAMARASGLSNDKTVRGAATSDQSVHPLGAAIDELKRVLASVDLDDHFDPELVDDGEMALMQAIEREAELRGGAVKAHAEADTGKSLHDTTGIARELSLGVTGQQNNQSAGEHTGDESLVVNKNANDNENPERKVTVASRRRGSQEQPSNANRIVEVVISAENAVSLESTKEGRAVWTVTKAVEQAGVVPFDTHMKEMERDFQGEIAVAWADEEMRQGTPHERDTARLENNTAAVVSIVEAKALNAHGNALAVRNEDAGELLAEAEDEPPDVEGSLDDATGPFVAAAVVTDLSPTKYSDIADSTKPETATTAEGTDVPNRYDYFKPAHFDQDIVSSYGAAFDVEMTATGENRVREKEQVPLIVLRHSAKGEFEPDERTAATATQFGGAGPLLATQSVEMTRLVETQAQRNSREVAAKVKSTAVAAAAMAAAETAEAVDAQQRFAEEEKLYAERHAAYLAILERRKGDMQVCLSIEEKT